jgi:hypothetical protein
METAILPRADRFALTIPILYHRPGDDHWFQAKVLNLSVSGVLFGPSELEAGASVEVILSPPIQIGGFAPGKQVCVAEVIRTTETQTVAARFEECRFLLED